jgi:hypothetical protein
MSLTLDALELRARAAFAAIGIDTPTPWQLEYVIGVLRYDDGAIAILGECGGTRGGGKTVARSAARVALERKDR